MRPRMACVPTDELERLVALSRRIEDACLDPARRAYEAHLATRALRMDLESYLKRAKRRDKE